MSIGPVSLFDSVKHNEASDCEDLSFDEFVKIMEAYSQDSFPSKDSAPLICTTRFKNNKRLKANASVSSIVVLDIDDHLNVEDVEATLENEGLRALVCSTASHRREHHKFRVFIPLAQPATYEEHVLAWHVLNHAIADGKADGSKIGCESLFYVPGQYPDAPSVFQDFSGAVFDAQQLIDLVGTQDDVLVLAGKTAKPCKVASANPNLISKRSLVARTGDADLDLKRTSLVSDRALDAYRSPSGSYHHARFGLLLSIAGRARRRRSSLSAIDLRDLFNQIDREDGGHYQSQEKQCALLAEAQKALSSV